MTTQPQLDKEWQWLDELFSKYSIFPDPWPLIEAIKSHIQQLHQAHEAELTALRADLAAAIGHMQGCGHPYGYLESKYPEFTQPQEEQHD